MQHLQQLPRHCRGQDAHALALSWACNIGRAQTWLLPPWQQQHRCASVIWSRSATNPMGSCALSSATMAICPAAPPPKPVLRMDDLHAAILSWDLERDVLQPSPVPVPAARGMSKPLSADSGPPGRFAGMQQYVDAFR